MDLALEAHGRKVARGYIDVSILVFVDLALEGNKSTTRSSKRGCFNPCFRGSGSRS